MGLITLGPIDRAMATLNPLKANQPSVKFAIAPGKESSGDNFERVAQCIASADLRWADPTKFLVQFSHSIRPRRTTVTFGQRDAESRVTSKASRSGKEIEVISIAVFDIANGNLVFRTEFSHKVSRKPQGKGAASKELCSAIQRASAQQDRLG